MTRHARARVIRGTHVSPCVEEFCIRTLIHGGRVDLISLIEKNNDVSQAQCVYRCFDVKELLA